MLATQGEAHAEWHRNSGNPIGLTSCPWDACDPFAAYEFERPFDPRAEDTEADPEDYADLDAMLADEAAADPWASPDAFDPPF